MERSENHEQPSMRLEKSMKSAVKDDNDVNNDSKMKKQTIDMMLGKGTQPVHKFMFDKEAVDIMYDNNPDFQQITPSNIKLSQFFLNSVVQKKKAQLNTINRQQPPPERSFESPSLLEA
jgi:hypothetical protein